MKMRSWLFVPGDSERKLAKIGQCGADIVVLDLEDAVAPDRKAAARKIVSAYLHQAHRPALPSLWVRINQLDSESFDADLAAIVLARPDGIMLPKCDGIEDVRTLDAQLAGADEIRIVATVTETARGVGNLASYAQHPRRLVALTWGGEDLAAELGASGNRDPDGFFRPLFQHVRARFRLAAAAAGLPAIDTIHADYRDTAGLAAYAACARADGFAGMLAIHPAQVEIINAAFTPTAAEIATARRIVAAFASGAGVIALDGRMLDRPHLVQARRVLELAGAGD